MNPVATELPVAARSLRRRDGEPPVDGTPQKGTHRRILRLFTGGAPSRGAALDRRASPSMNFGNLSLTDSLTSNDGGALPVAGSVSDRYYRIGTPDVLVSSFSSDDEYSVPDYSCCSSIERSSLHDDKVVKQKVSIATQVTQPLPESIISQDVGEKERKISKTFSIESNVAFDSFRSSDKRTDRSPRLKTAPAARIQNGIARGTDSPMLPLTDASIFTVLSGNSSAGISPRNQKNSLSHSTSRFTYSESDITAATTPATTPNFQPFDGVVESLKSPLCGPSDLTPRAAVDSHIVEAHTIDSGNMDTLKLPVYYLPITVQTSEDSDDPNNTEAADPSSVVVGASLLSVVYGTNSSSPPRSSSFDLSTLRRDIELWSISSLEKGATTSNGESESQVPAEEGPSGPQIADETSADGWRRREAAKSLQAIAAGGPPPTSPVDAISIASLVLSARTSRSRSHNPTECPEHVLCRPSRIKHLSEIFR